MQPEYDGPILPSFSDLYVLHGFSTPLLALDAGVEAVVLDRMLMKEPVSVEDAKKVLYALFVRTGEPYNLQTVVVNLIEDSARGKE